MEPYETKCFHPLDIPLAPATIPGPRNPFDVEFSATFHGPGGHAMTIPGYYDGDGGYVVRFSPTVEGQWHYTSHAPLPALDGLTGTVHCAPNDNPHVHGQLRVDGQHPQHFVYEDGTRCFLLGYEANWLMMMDQSPSDLARVSPFLDSISQAGFDLLTVNAYAHTCRGWVSEDQERDSRYITPALAPWIGGNAHPDYRQMDVAFFRHYDRVMLALHQRGILAHIMIHVYNKQVNWPPLGSEDDDRFWRYIIARYQAFPNVIWDPAKECYYQPAAYIWERMGIIRKLDGYHRLLTVHDANVPYIPGSEWSQRWHDPRKDLSDALADFGSDQVHEDWYADAQRNHNARQRPYVNVEYGYEQGVERLPTYGVQQDWREVLRRTWLVTMGGGYANYYYSNTAWNLFAPTPEPPGYAAHRRYLDFWLGTHYWLLAPDNAPLTDTSRHGVYCRANPGQEYVVWDESGAGFTLAITQASALLRGTWFNPLSGERREAGEFANGAHRFLSPWGNEHWALLHLRPPSSPV